VTKIQKKRKKTFFYIYGLFDHLPMGTWLHSSRRIVLHILSFTGSKSQVLKINRD